MSEGNDKSKMVSKKELATMLNYIETAMRQDDPSIVFNAAEKLRSDYANAENEHVSFTVDKKTGKATFTSGVVDATTHMVGDKSIQAVQELMQERDKYKELYEAAISYIDKSPCDLDIYPEQKEIAAWDKLQTLIKKHGV